jgi:hypothetical protein
VGDVLSTSQVPNTDPLQEEAGRLFAEDLAADRVPPIRTVRAQLHVGQPRAQRIRDYLVGPGAETLSSGHRESARQVPYMPHV